MMRVYTSNKECIQLEEKSFSSGGEGEVFRVLSCPARFVNVCVKIYFKPKQTKEQEEKIRFMVNHPPSNIKSDGMMIAWPLDIIYNDRGAFIGFLMPMAFPDSKKLTILILPKLKKSIKAEWYKFDKEYNTKAALVARMKLINNIAIPIHLLHITNQYVLKDFKPDNVLVTPIGKVTLVDMDSIQICHNGKLLFPGNAATDTYIPPEFYKGVGTRKTDILQQSWDYFAVSIVFYQLLFGLHPYVVIPHVETEESSTISYCIKENLFPFGANKYKIKSYAPPHNNFNIVPEQIKSLFIRAFGDNPNNRPSAKDWGMTIKQVVDTVPPDSGTQPPPPPPPPPSPPPSPPETYYAISVSSSILGSVQVSTNRARIGELVQVYAKPNDGVILKEIVCITAIGKTSIGLRNSFNMPASDVKVRAVFVRKKIPSSNTGCALGGCLKFIAICVFLCIIFLVCVAMFFNISLSSILNF